MFAHANLYVVPALPIDKMFAYIDELRQLSHFHFFSDYLTMFHWRRVHCQSHCQLEFTHVAGLVCRWDHGYLCVVQVMIKQCQYLNFTLQWQLSHCAASSLFSTVTTQSLSSHSVVTVPSSQVTDGIGVLLCYQGL